MKLDHASVVEDILELKYVHLTREKVDDKWLEMIGY